MKRYWYRYTLLCLFIVGCAMANELPVTVTVTSATTPSSAMIGTLRPSPTFTPTLYRFVLPLITMSSQESESALLELLKTNGDCAGKCIAGIRPDTMTVQDAAQKLSQWGPMSIFENPNGETYITLDQNPLYGQVAVYLSIGTWTKKLETIDRVRIRIQDSSDIYLREDALLAYRDTLQGFSLDKLLKAYGVPSYVGYDFTTNVQAGSPLEEEPFCMRCIYNMNK
ncbi:MAG: hypothetical protein IPM31_16655 [Anaerolineae bacterium]|nr:hypothetical protein [Anaerolineae bacterium]